MRFILLFINHSEFFQNSDEQKIKRMQAILGIWRWSNLSTNNDEDTMLNPHTCVGFLFSLLSFRNKKQKNRKTENEKQQGMCSISCIKKNDNAVGKTSSHQTTHCSNQIEIYQERIYLKTKRWVLPIFFHSRLHVTTIDLSTLKRYFWCVPAILYCL